ncbi:MAG: histidine kinase [Saprospiraceae bacterium]|uniref:Histidine kinase n=1 Tax=Candidatus Opimibacter skivensis TaxID=2982028 RepID=A0A9D7XSS7_9BACT|nr:histidine kinase [Candidatus Opimibacter skivensis]
MIKKLILLLSVVSVGIHTMAQSNITFRHLSTNNGLSYLGVVDMVTDKKGNLWIGTGNGLNMFNGKSVEKYYATEYPQLQNSYIVHVACDSNNRIWVLTSNGNLTIVDEKRKFHRVGLYDQKNFVKTRWIIETENGNLLLFTSKGHYFLTPGTPLTELDSLSFSQFTPYEIAGFDSLQTKYYKQIFHYDDTHYLLVQDDGFYKVNYRTKKVEKKYVVPYCNALTKMDGDALMYFDKSDKEVKIVDLSTEEITFPFRDLKDQFGKPVNATFNFAERINAHQYILTTQLSGIYIYDYPSNKIYNHTHHFADATTISDNVTSTIEVSPSGWVFITCNPEGISYYNSNEIIGNQNVFIDQNGNGYDGYIAGIATKDNNTFYIGTAVGLLQWKRNTNTTQFLNYHDEKGEPLPSPQEIVSITIDRFDHVWVTTNTQGIIVLDKNNNLLRHITSTGKPNYAIKMERLLRLVIGPDGFVWATGKNGICKINPATFEVDNLKNSILSKYDSLSCVLLLFTDKDNLWTSTSNGGVTHFNLATNQMKKYTTKDGLLSNGIFDLGADSSKNIYIGTRIGLNILFTDGRIKTLTQKDGLLIDRAEGLLLDKHNRMWIGNDIGLACYTPEDSSLTTFDARHGLSIFGFRVGSYFQIPDGEFVFGTPRGLQYFYPDSLFNKKITLNALINKIETKDIVSHINDNATFNLSSTDRQVTFYFSSIEYSPHVRTYYEYQLSNIDDKWIKVADQNSVKYNSLPPGKYVFRVRISNDNKNWQSAENEVTIIIAAPFYQRWWFRIVSIGILIFGLYRFFVGLNKKQKIRTEELETEAVINYFASRINRHKTTDELLWDVVKNCISKLQFEDCVIYLLDAERNVLVQKAAYGPKSGTDFTIHQPIDIPVGQGIVGNVAISGEPALINDTSKDVRYIVDDQQRLSELAVPITMDGKVIGVIDSENHKKNFFTQRHLSILSTIAVLCVNQIQRNDAEAEKQKAKIEVLQNKQKAAESRLQSLRLQMNPHFLFNALNSIQQMILANEEMVATKYLSRFSKLLRSILIHSDKESISLKEELDILKLYVELEAVRFKDAFTYEIHCDEDIDTDEVKIPTLLIQPFVENAIWHGLMHKEGMRKLKISFTDEGEYVQCIIEDNGIGRQKARELKITSGQDKKHTSKGIEVSLERLNAIQKQGGISGTMEIIDLKDKDGLGIGTRVEINLPIQN